ncbi:MAG TPA: uracil-DNA glycosylase family protein [Bacteroidales bacterium]|nr:uracil-DNA glycosylase family protein [Bacteroidales bacterium]HPQ55679.1 uracil-DNA glycosylase family protein [Bacteroidales bacterium]
MRPFLPGSSRILLLGSFPPPVNRWSMDFYYPNFQNDMWRIMGLIFYNNPLYFIKEKAFDKERITTFCKEKGIALYDTAMRIVRGSGNASDKFLEVLQPIDIENVLTRLPGCKTVAVTGQKAGETLLEVIRENGYAGKLSLPAMGNYITFLFRERTVKLYRMPSTSRAYPMSLEKKASYYRTIIPTLL